MIIAKLGVLTCLFYLAICVVLDLLILVWARFGPQGMFMVKGWPVYLLFGGIWFCSFYSASRILMAALKTN
jgi:hypothetical protein